MNRTSIDLPDYGLYGEPARAAFPDLLHIERLSARSGPRRWRIASHRHPSLHQIFWILEGGGRLQLAGEEIPLAPPVLLNLPAGATHGFRFTPGTRGSVLTLPVSVFEPIRAPLDPHGRLTRPLVLPLAADGGPAGGGARGNSPGGAAAQERGAAEDAQDGRPAEGAQAGQLAAALPELLHLEHGRRPEPGAADTRAAALAALATLACLATLRLAEAASARHGADPDGGGSAASAAGGRLFARFLALIERRLAGAGERNGGGTGQEAALGVAGCAAALAVTPTHLSRVCRERAGKPASALIRERQMLEARRLLASTQQDVAGIAWRIGFADPSYFARVFTAETGLSPRAFRAGFSRPGRRGGDG